MKKRYLFSCIFYLFAAAIIFPYIRWYADNPDTFQYLAIANKYLLGDWAYAVNGYWSPLISWLLTIPLLFFTDQLLAFKNLQVLIGLYTLWQWLSLLDKTTLNKTTKNILEFSIIPFLLDYSLLNCTPDLLFMGLLFKLINLLLSGSIFTNKSLAVQTGLTGGLLYLTKAFGFPFFIVFISIIIFFEIKKNDRIKTEWKNVVRLYGVFFLVSFIWIVTLSFHYNHFTISEAARFNMSREAAPLPGRPASLPVLNKGLFAPLEHSYSAWESPGEYVSNEKVTLFNSTSDYLKIVKRNLLSIYYFDFSHQTGIVFLFLLLLFIIVNGFRELFKEKWVLILLLFIFLLYGGYSLILVHSRYTWINNLLMLILSVYFIQSIFIKKGFKFIVSVFFLSVLLLAVKRPVKEILFSTDSDYPALWLFNAMKHPVTTMRIFYRSDIELHNVIEDIKSTNMLSGNVASLKMVGKDRDPYTRSLQVAQILKCRYYGQLDDELNFSLQEDELIKMDIDYLITWENTEWGNKEPIYYSEETGTRIYSLK